MLPILFVLAAAAPAMPSAGSPATGTVVAVPSPPIDPARLAAARAVVDFAFPAEAREAMFTQTSAAMLATLRRSFDADPAFRDKIDADPRVRAVFDRFYATIQLRSQAAIKAALPDLFEAYAHAYARRFTLAQLGELRAFFATPTGQLFTTRSAALVGDPDVMAAQQALFTATRAATRADLKAMQDEIAALSPASPGPAAK